MTGLKLPLYSIWDVYKTEKFNFRHLMDHGRKGYNKKDFNIIQYLEVLAPVEKIEVNVEITEFFGQNFQLQRPLVPDLAMRLRLVEYYQ